MPSPPFLGSVLSPLRLLDTFSFAAEEFKKISLFLLVLNSTEHIKVLDGLESGLTSG